MKLELTEFQVLTPGLYTGDPLKISFNYRVTCTGWQCNLGWMTKVLGKLNGQTISGGTAEIDRHIGEEGGDDGTTLEFTGLMPNHDLSGEFIFEWKHLTGTSGVPGIWGPGHGVEFARRHVSIANLGGLVACRTDEDCPSGYQCVGGQCVKIGGCRIDTDCPKNYRCVNGVCIPAVTCVDGETQCRGDDLYICQSNQWTLYEKDSPQCGYEPPPYCIEGETKCFGTDLYRCQDGQYVLHQRDAAECGYIPPPPDGNGGVEPWIEKYKWVIIGVSVAVVIGAVIFTIKRK